MRARVHFENLQRCLLRGETDRTEQPPLAAGDLEERQRHGLRPDFFVARHGGAAVQADDHGSFALLFDASKGILEQFLVKEAAVEVFAQDRVVQGQEFVGKEPVKRVASLDLQDFLARSLEDLFAQRHGVKLHAPDHPREFF